MGFKKTNEGRVFFQRSNRNVGALEREKNDNDEDKGVFNIRDPEAQNSPLFDKETDDIRRSPLTGREIRIKPKPFEIRDPVLEKNTHDVIQDDTPQTEPEPSQTTQDIIPQTEILGLLRSLNQRLKTTKAERDHIQKQMDVYHALIEGLEDKSETAQKAYEDLKTQISGREEKANARAEKAEQIALETRKELEETRKLLKDLEDKSQKTETSIGALDQKIDKTKTQYDTALSSQKEVITAQTETLKKDVLSIKTETQKTAKTIAQTAAIAAKDAAQKDATALFETLKAEISATNERQDELSKQIGTTLEQQAGLVRKIDEVADDRARFMRKIELIEQTVLQTHDALGALRTYNDETQGLITGKAQQAENTDLPRALLKQSQENYKNHHNEKPSTIMRIIIHPFWMWLLAFVLGAMLIFWTLSGPRLTWLENTLGPRNSPLAETPLSDVQTPSIQNLQTPTLAIPSDVVFDNAIDVTDPENATLLNEIMGSNPDALGSAMNALEPSIATDELQNTPQEIEDTSATVDLPSADPQEDTDTQTESRIESSATEIPTNTEKPVSSSNLPDIIARVERAALGGSAQAQHDLAAIYVSGYEGVERNYERAAYWFEKAANQNVANAAYNLGVLHHQGLGMPADIKTALRWYEKAAKLKHPEAQYNLGIAYIEGVGVNYDAKKAADYFRAAADKDIMEAAYNLGLIYENGLLGQARPDDALIWYKAAADQGSAEAQAAIEQLTKRLNLNPDELGSLDQKSKELQTSPQSVIRKTQTQLAAPLSPIQNERILVAQIQEYLIQSGLYPGPADGQFGPLTRDAIRTYQTRSGLPVNGEADQALLHHMLSNET